MRIFIILLLMLSPVFLLAQDYAISVGPLFHAGSEYGGKKYGKWFVRDSNDKIYQIQFYKNGVRDSVWVTFNPGGEVRNRIRYRDGLATEWKTYIDKQLHMKISSEKGINDHLIEDLRLAEDFHQFNMIFKDAIIDEVEKSGMYLKDSFYENPLWQNTIESDIYEAVETYKASISLEEWNVEEQMVQEVEFEGGVLKDKIIYEYKKSELRKKKFYQGKKLVKVEKYKNGLLLKEMEK